MNHFILPLMIIHQNWQPFLSCRLLEACRLDFENYAYLLPLVVGVAEIVGGYAICCLETTMTGGTSQS